MVGILGVGGQLELREGEQAIARGELGQRASVSRLGSEREHTRDRRPLRRDRDRRLELGLVAGRRRRRSSPAAPGRRRAVAPPSCPARLGTPAALSPAATGVALPARVRVFRGCVRVFARTESRRRRNRVGMANLQRGGGAQVEVPPLRPPSPLGARAPPLGARAARRDPAGARRRSACGSVRAQGSRRRRYARGEAASQSPTRSWSSGADRRALPVALERAGPRGGAAGLGQHHRAMHGSRSPRLRSWRDGRSPSASTPDLETDDLPGRPRRRSTTSPSTRWRGGRRSLCCAHPDASRSRSTTTGSASSQSSSARASAWSASRERLRCSTAPCGRLRPEAPGPRCARDPADPAR